MKRYRTVEVGMMHELYDLAEGTITAREDHDVTEPHDHEDERPPMIWQLARWNLNHANR